MIEYLINNDFSEGINNEIMLLRKEVLILNIYYNQLGDIIDILGDKESDFFNENECHLLKRQAKRIDCLDNLLTFPTIVTTIFIDCYRVVWNEL